MAVATKKATAVTNGEGGPVEKVAPALRINRIQVETIRVPITGTAPLISHRFDEKARKMMLEKQTARKRLREVRDPVAEYNACLYRISAEEYIAANGGRDPNEAHSTVSQRRRNAANAQDPAKRGGRVQKVEVYGFPASAFRQATIGAARFYDKSVTMKGLTQMFMVKGILTKADPLWLVTLEGEPEPREDTVRLPNGNAEVRFRAMFPTWSTVLEIDYVASSIDQESLLSLVDAGGQFVGVGDWRPECTGQYGTYEIGGSVEVVQK